MKRLAVILGILIIGLGGYFAWNHAQDKKHNSETQSKTTQQQSTTPSSSAQKKDDPTEGGRFLVIKEWGVRMPLTSVIADAYYTYTPDSVINLSTKTVNDIASCEDTQTMPLERGRTGDLIGASSVDEFLTENPSALTKVGDYYYLFFPGSFSCAHNDGQKQRQLLDEVRQAFATGTKMLEEIKESP